jgi:hypothetical protein
MTKNCETQANGSEVPYTITANDTAKMNNGDCVALPESWGYNGTWWKWDRRTAGDFPTCPVSTNTTNTTHITTAAGIIKGDITIQVSDAEAFVQDVNTSKAVASGLATTLGLKNPGWVSLTLTVLARRLQGRQLTAGIVNAAFTITIPANSGVDVSAMAASASSVNTSKLAAAITLALHTMSPSSSYSLTVTGVTASVVSATVLGQGLSLFVCFVLFLCFLFVLFVCFLRLLLDGCMLLLLRTHVAETHE